MGRIRIRFTNFLLSRNRIPVFSRGILFIVATGKNLAILRLKFLKFTKALVRHQGSRTKLPGAYTTVMQITCTTPGITGGKNGLISSTGLHSKKEIVYSKLFQHSSHTLSLRPLNIPLDMPAIYNWAWKLSRAADTVAASYLYAGSSDFARSFMVLLNNRLALCQIDICSADKDELYDTYPTSNGDYIIRLLMNTNRSTVRPLHLRALQTCLEYFFLFPEIRQVIAEPETDNIAYNEILLKAGFQFEEQVYNQYALCNLFVCTRQSFISA